MRRRLLTNRNKLNIHAQLEELLKFTFGEINSEDFKTERTNDLMMSHEKKLDKKKHDLFNTLTIITPPEEKNWEYVFRSKKGSSVDAPSVQLITDKLFEILGIDDMGKDVLSDAEWNVIQMKNFDWEGRHWKKGDTIELRFEGNYENGFVLTIKDLSN